MTQICLIPKIPGATLMYDLRPIIICTVMYKIVANILASRIKPFLPDLVSQNQSAFVSDRMSSDNIIIAHESLHALRSVNSISKEFIAIKSDMSKAYDRVEWDYLQDLLLALGFHPRWVGWIMFYVRSVSYTILINGQPHGFVKLCRGLRQGDPLSPFLFVLCSEGLTFLLNQASHQHLLTGMKFSPQGPQIHHLLFADDTLFLVKAYVDECSVVSEILSIYERATCQMINLDKFSIIFGSKVNEEKKYQIKEVLGIFKEGGDGSYLGLPEVFMGSKVKMMSFLKDNMRDRLSGYYARLTSQGGKEVLLKSIAMALPVYTMTCFRLPKMTCDNLESAMADFWWNADEHKIKIHWVCWENMCLPKKLGGIGFKDIQIFNQALLAILAKQAWRILQHPQSLFAEYVKSRYFPDINFLKADLGKSSSYAWRSILYGRELLILGLRRMIGNGRSVNVWTGKWLNGGQKSSPLMRHGLVDLDLTVADLIDNGSKWWDIDKIRDLFYPEDVELITKINPIPDEDDYWIWEHNRNGDYSVRSGYWFGCEVIKKEQLEKAFMLPSLNDLKKRVWKVKAPYKIKTFMWKILSEALPMADNILSRGMKIDSRCQICGLEGESSNHVLFSCTWARKVWALSGIPHLRSIFSCDSVYQNMDCVLKLMSDRSVSSQFTQSIPWLLWLLWKNRNDFLFEGRMSTTSNLVEKSQKEAGDWLQVQMIEGRETSRINNRVRGDKLSWQKPM